MEPTTSPATTTPASDAPAERLPLGEVLVREGLVPREEVERAIALQATEARRGVFLRLGELLVARGLLDEATVARVLAMQGRTILVCPSCLAQFNVVGHEGARTYRCNRCDVALERPEQLRRLSVEDTVGPEEARASGTGALLLPEGAQRQFGPYRVLGEISRGGMGIIYKARHDQLDRVVAMKVMSRPDRAQDAERFLLEARAVARLRHPYIVAIHDIGRIEGVDYFTMDYIEGLPLHRAVTSEALTERELAELFVKLCDAVDYAHGQGVLHRDIKPANILLDRKRDPVLLDFGIADLDEVAEDQGHILGSPAYLPPEYVKGTAPYGVAGEVYALGASLYTVLAGRPPHTGIDTVQVLRRAEVEDVVPVRRVRRTVDRDLATIVMTALARDPGQRYATVRELRNDLARWLEGEEVTGRRSPLLRLWHRIRSRVAAALGLLLALLTLVSSLTYSVQLSNLRDEDQRRIEQMDRDREAMRVSLDAMRGSLTQARLELARLLLEARRPGEAEALLTDLLRVGVEGKLGGRLHLLRADAREATGDAAGAAADRDAAAALGVTEDAR
ncbi:MAG: protein kinase [Planctomycetes bacterium]|nr:protein kinase [Planctomycetota bacterium]